MSLIKIDELRKCTTVKKAINKMFGMCYKDTYPIKTGIFKGKKYKSSGLFVKHDKISYDSRETRFDTFFKACENVYYKLFNTAIEKNDMEEHIQDARMTSLEVLYNYADKCTNLANGIDITTVDKLCNMLEDEEKCAMVYSYLLKTVKSIAYKSLYNEGSNTSASRDYYFKRITKDGVRRTERVNVEYVFLDKSSSSDEESLDKYSVLDIHNEKEGNEIDVEGIVFGSNDYSTGTLQYILDSKDRIFTKKQLDKLEQLRSNGQHFGDVHNRKRYEQNFVKKALDKLVNDKFCYIKNEQLRVKNIEFLNAVENIINAPTPFEQFEVIRDVLINKNDISNTIFEKLIYGLTEGIIRNLVYCLNVEIDKNWIRSDGFKEIIKALIKEYNYQIKNAKLIYNPDNEITKEDKVKNYIEKNCFFVENKEFGLVSKSSTCGASIPNLQDITDFVNKVYSEQFEKKQIRPLLKELGYDVDVKKRTVKNNIPCYKIEKVA